MLHITNGDSVRGTLKLWRPADEILAWNDVLHEGPVPAGLSFEALSRLRVQFIVDCGWGPIEDVAREFGARDAALARFREHDEVVLWFEHDLFDQLQLIQLLDWFAGQELGPTRLRLICVGQFPGQEKFHGLGTLNPDQLASLFPGRRPVADAQLALARRAWAAFRSPNPLGIQALLDADTTALPFLSGALVRHLEQFPSARHGLSRTERQILEVLSSVGPARFVQVFVAEGDREERLFIGDETLKLYLQALGSGDDALVSFDGRLYDLTAVGRSVLAREGDAIRLRGIDRWLGGVHLKGHDVPWRWDEQSRRLAHVT